MENEIIKNLTEWFSNIDSNNKNFWQEDEIGRFLKQQLINIGHWKNKSTGKREANRSKLIAAREKLKQLREQRLKPEESKPKITEVPTKIRTPEEQRFYDSKW